MTFFEHIQYNVHYTDYAIKNGMLINESNLNAYQLKLKKEVNDNYNRFRVFIKKNALEWRSSESYEIGEIVSFNEVNYICIKNSFNNEPDRSTDYWKIINDTDLSDFSLSNYLHKHGQEEYNPESLIQGETSFDYHPTTVKYVKDSIDTSWNTRKAIDSDKLDGFDSTYFAIADDVKTNYVKYKDIINNTTSTNVDKPLSAFQGKLLRDDIAKIQKLLKSDDVSLDELQEIVNFIKNNKKLIDSLGIDSIKGLRENLTRLETATANAVTLNMWRNDFKTQMLANDGSGSGLDADLLDGRDSSYFLPKDQFTPINILNHLKTVQGTGSELDADKIDGLDSTSFIRRDKSDTPTEDNVFDLGSNQKRWKSIYSVDFVGTALKARYADLAEIYKCSNYKDFEFGEVLGIDKEGNISLYNTNNKLLGVVSENPGIVINENEEGVCIALKGKTPVRIKGNFEIGDYVIAKNEYNIAQKDYTFSESKSLIGTIVEKDSRGFAVVKI